jgi:hypothetical protein
MKSTIFLVLSLTACGARVDTPLQEPAETSPIDPIDSVAPPTDSKPSTSPSELLRTENELCAFGAGAGHVVWIDAATRKVNVARAPAGSAARALGTASRETCALAVFGTRFCFGDAGGSLTCMNVDGTALEVHGERKATDPVRAIEVGSSRSLVFARRRTVYGRFGEEASFNAKTVDQDIVAVAGDFEPSPDDGVELAAATTSALHRISFGETKPVAIAAPVAVRALHYSSYLVLGVDGMLRSVHANDGTTTELEIGSGIQAIVHSDNSDGENLVIVRDGQIVAMHGTLYFDPKVSNRRTVAPAAGDVVSLALDEDQILWATRAGEIRRATRKVE